MDGMEFNNLQVVNQCNFQLQNLALGWTRFCWIKNDGSNIRLMEEIPNNHQGCIKTMKIKGYLPYQLVQDFFHQPYGS